MKAIVSKLKTKLNTQRQKYKRVKKQLKKVVKYIEKTPKTRIEDMSEDITKKKELVKKALFGEVIKIQLEENYTKLKTHEERKKINQDIPLSTYVRDNDDRFELDRDKSVPGVSGYSQHQSRYSSGDYVLSQRKQNIIMQRSDLRVAQSGRTCVGHLSQLVVALDACDCPYSPSGYYCNPRNNIGDNNSVPGIPSISKWHNTTISPREPNEDGRLQDLPLFVEVFGQGQGYDHSYTGESQSILDDPPGDHEMEGCGRLVKRWQLGSSTGECAPETPFWIGGSVVPYPVSGQKTTGLVSRGGKRALPLAPPMVSPGSVVWGWDPGGPGPPGCPSGYPTLRGPKTTVVASKSERQAGIAAGGPVVWCPTECCAGLPAPLVPKATHIKRGLPSVVAASGNLCLDAVCRGL
ncbi:hypothetical protein FQA39_LY00383 [Lamprigera yunnana]|nr:hypothetical protein FQA39_LY00383 [Lamprigera yunnana]